MQGIALHNSLIKLLRQGIVLHISLLKLLKQRITLHISLLKLLSNVAVFILFFFTPSFAQIRSLPLTLNIELLDTLHREDFNKVKKQLSSQKTFPDSFAIKKELQQIILK